MTQESVLTYEVGLNQPLFNRPVRVTAAAFYNDYTDKQLRGRIIDPLVGPLEKLVNIPNPEFGAWREVSRRVRSVG